VKPYIYTDEDGHDLTLESFAVGAGVATEETVFIYKDHLPEVAGKLYEAAGLTAPVMLERPGPRKILVAGPQGDEEVRVSPSRTGSPSNLPGVMLRVGGAAQSAEIRLIGDEPLRVAVALVDAKREAEAPPDPAEAEAAELAAYLREHAPDPNALTVARVALAWMREREAGS
jgi:hypothetical protein